MIKTVVIKAQYRFAVQVSDTTMLGLCTTARHKNKFYKIKFSIIFE